MREHYMDIFNYHHHFNQAMIRQVAEIVDSLPARVVPLLSHIVNAHQIWNARILNLEKLGVHDVYPLHKLVELDNNNFEKTNEILESRSMQEVIVYNNSKGVEFANSIQDILFHASNHTTHHRGQIVFDIRQSGFEPMVTDYIFYRR